MFRYRNRLPRVGTAPASFLYLEAAFLRLAAFLLPDLATFTSGLNPGDPLNPFLGSPVGA
jgi:hypothetical protein